MRTAAQGATDAIMVDTLCSTIEPRALAEHLTGQYPALGAIEDCTLYSRGHNDVYKVKTSGRDNLAVRIPTVNWRTRSQLVAEAEAVRALADSGLPVATPIQASDGDWTPAVATPEGVRYSIVHAWAPGEQPQYSQSQQVALYARLAARLHDIRGKFDGRGLSTIDLDYLVDAPMEQLRPSLAHHPSASSYFEGLRARIHSRAGAFEQLSWGFCHGDLHFGNVVDTAGELTVFDFEFCGLGWQVYDLATFCWAARLRGHYGTAKDTFIREYLASRSVARAELEVLPLFVIMRHLWLMGHHARMAYLTGVAYQTPAYFEQAVAFCRKLEDTKP
jgi:Ser/Thr protein kinase RdoA (MazF antagonist)